jgi:ATP phosphoribosyltransferase regulatory subunit HisZ
METEIRKSLEALLAAITAGNGQIIAEEMLKLDDYVDRGSAGLHPQLVHFLRNRSYAKARMFLAGDAEIPAGICGGGRPQG